MKTIYQSKMEGKYQAVLFHPEGDYVSDFWYKGTKQEVWEELAEMGSRWIFYPICFVATDKTIVDVPEGLEFLKNKRIETVVKFLQSEWKQRANEICDLLNDGMPLNIVY